MRVDDENGKSRSGRDDFLSCLLFEAGSIAESANELRRDLETRGCGTNSSSAADSEQDEGEQAGRRGVGE